LYDTDESPPSFEYEDVIQIFELYQKKNFNIKDFPFEEALKKCKYKFERENIAGHWFEDYVYHQIVKNMPVKPEQIGRSVLIYMETEQLSFDQEIDYMFVYNNELYMVECKISANSTQTIVSDLSKMNMLSDNLGLSSHSFFITLKDLRTGNGHNFGGSLKNKIKLYKIQNIADANDLARKDFNWFDFFNSKI